ncbi:hypothetical protein [Vibrio sagamiensis]|uniref:hypothetical protein n=1 Tax=Vibrio sagamiensis TaxID=512650 RepID=UPI0011BD5AF6|nr:hypothetical protein [Vibrio sagamiensis]
MRSQALKNRHWMHYLILNLSSFSQSSSKIEPTSNTTIYIKPNKSDCIGFLKDPNKKTPSKAQRANLLNSNFLSTLIKNRKKVVNKKRRNTGIMTKKSLPENKEK